jgi:cytochrome c556
MKSEIGNQETNGRMRIVALGFAFLACAGMFVLVETTSAQTPAPGQAKGGPTPAKAKTAAPASRTPATLAQLMKGILYPNSNVIFFAQGDNPADVPPAKDPATAINPLASSYGKWEAVENSALAIEEAANLLTIPGRKCSNGLAVPVNNPDWPKLVQGLRDAGIAAYKAAQSKSQDKILDAADVMTTACANCHDKYREKPTPAERCK